MSEIVLFGATGFTGKLVAAELRARGLPFAVAGRSQERVQRLAEELGGVPARVADAAQPRTLGALVAGARVLVNCAGPFLRWGEPVLRATVEAGAHYLDTTGEQLWMKRVLDGYDGPALRNQVTVIAALGFEYAIGDWLAALVAGQLGRGEPIDSISMGYGVSGSGITRGTALSLWEMVGAQGWSYEAGRWRRRAAGWTRRQMRFLQGEREVTWLPFGEPILVPRHERVQTVLTFMRLPRHLARLLPLASAAGPAVAGALRLLAERAIARQPEGPTDAQRRATRFAIVAEAQRGGRLARATATGADPYGLTARIAALGAEQLLTEAAPRGVQAPATLPLDPAAALAGVGVAVTSGE